MSLSMKAYLDNVICSGRIREDIEASELAALRTLEQPPFSDAIEIVTSRESWREQERARDPDIRETLLDRQTDIPVVANDHRLLGFSEQQDQYGGFISNPLVSDIVDEPLYAELQAIGLKPADARHFMYAATNECERFVTLDPDFLDRSQLLEKLRPSLRIVKPSDLLTELL